MDRSERYRRIAGAAKEVQKKWNPKPGDFAYCPWMENPMFGLYDCTILTNDYQDRNLKGEAIWLPRVDQIIDMFDESLSMLLAKFYLWVSGDARFIYSTLEQLFLGYYMYDKYSKKWTGKEWERIK